MARKLVDLSTLSEADIQRFWRLADIPESPEDCWGWRGYIHAHSGYGYVLAVGNSRPAHRVGYTIAFGPVPDGLILDHLCRNRGCVNPSHLEPVTNAENLRRGLRGVDMRPTCPKGHAYDAIVQGRHRRCNTCARETNRAWRRRLADSRVA